MDEHKQVIETYVRESLAAGYAPEAIRAQLMQSGWSQSAIDEAMQAQTTPPEPLLEPTNPEPATVTQPAQPSLAATATSPSAKSGRLWLSLGLVLAVIVLLLGVFLFVHSRESTNTTSTAGLSAEQRAAQDTQRSNDVSKLLTGIGQFITNNNGTLPTQTVTGSGARELDICGPTCDANKTTVTLNYFQNAPTAVSFHAYKQSLTVPNDQTAYIIPQATCTNGSLAPNQARSVAILSESATLGQQCTAL